MPEADAHELARDVLHMLLDDQPFKLDRRSNDYAGGRRTELV